MPDIPYLFGVPAEAHMEHLRYANEKVAEGGQYTEHEARISYMLDIDRGLKRMQKDYARIWGWSEATVSRKIGQIKEDARDWLTMYKVKRERLKSTNGKAVDETEESTEESNDLDESPETGMKPPCKRSESDMKSGNRSDPQDSGVSDSKGMKNEIALQALCNRSESVLKDITYTDYQTTKLTYSSLSLLPRGREAQPESRDPPTDDPIEILKQFFPDHKPGNQQVLEITTVVDDNKIWTECCRKWAYSEYLPWSFKLLDFYREQVAEKEHAKTQHTRNPHQKSDAAGGPAPRKSARERANQQTAASIQQSTERTREILRRVKQGGPIRDGPDTGSG